MERRFLLAITLMMAVLIGPSFFAKRRPPLVPAADTTATVSAETGDRRLETVAPAGARTPPSVTARAQAVPTVSPISTASTASTAADTMSLQLPRATYRFSSLGGGIDQAVYPDIKSFRKGDQ